MRSQLHIRHETSGLDSIWLPDPRAEVFHAVWNNSGGKCVSAHQVRKVRAERSGGRRSAHGVTIHARKGEELNSSGFNPYIINRVLPLPRRPLFEICLRLNDDSQTHIGVLSSAVL